MSLWKAEQFRPTEIENTPQPDTATSEWLDRYPWLPILFLILLPFLVELPLLIFGLSTNPIWFDSGITFGTHGGMLPGLPYIDPNVGFTSQALGHLAAEDWLHGTIPWWNPYSGIGLPLAGEMQPNAFFLPFVFLQLLLHNGVLWLKIAMQIMAGLATFALLRELKLGHLAALTGGALYALNGTFAWMPGETICNTIPFLPLLLYGIERARKESGAPAILWIGLAIRYCPELWNQMRQNFQEVRETAALATGSSVIPFHVERDAQGQPLMPGQPVIPFGANGSGP